MQRIRLTKDEKKLLEYLRDHDWVCENLKDVKKVKDVRLAAEGLEAVGFVYSPIADPPLEATDEAKRYVGLYPELGNPVDTTEQWLTLRWYYIATLVVSGVALVFSILSYLRG